MDHQVPADAVHHLRLALLILRLPGAAAFSRPAQREARPIAQRRAASHKQQLSALLERTQRGSLWRPTKRRGGVAASRHLLVSRALRSNPALHRVREATDVSTPLERTPLSGGQAAAASCAHGAKQSPPQSGRRRPRRAIPKSAAGSRMRDTSAILRSSSDSIALASEPSARLHTSRFHGRRASKNPLSTPLAMPPRLHSYTKCFAAFGVAVAATAAQFIVDGCRMRLS